MKEKTKKNQGLTIIDYLKKRWMTYLEMEALKVSTCPWKRVPENIPLGWRLEKRTNRDGLIEWRIVRNKNEAVTA